MKVRVLAWVRALWFVIDLRQISKLLKIRNENSILIIVFDNTFQTPSDAGLSQRNLEKIFQYLELKQLKFHIVRPLFSTRMKKKKNRPISSLESLSFLYIFNYARIYLNSRKSNENKELFNFNYWIWIEIFKFLKPSIIIGQSLPEPSLIAANYLNIKSIEIQHGIWFEDEDPVLSFDIKTRATSPSDILIWNKYYSSMLHNSQSKVGILGYPSFNLGIGETKDVGNVLICLSTGVKNSVDPFGTVRPEIDHAIRVLSEKKFKLTIRPHPLTSQNERTREKIYSYLQENYKTTNVESPYKYKLANQLEKCEAIVTYDGSIIIDGALQGRSVFYFSKAKNLGLPPDLVYSGVVRLVVNSEDLLNQMTLMRSRPSYLSSEIKNKWSFQPEIISEILER
jgi:hypothetical protein